MAYMSYNEDMPVSLQYTVRGVTSYTREQIRVLAAYEHVSAAYIIEQAVEDYYLKAVHANPAVNKFVELSRD